MSEIHSERVRKARSCVFVHEGLWTGDVVRRVDEEIDETGPFMVVTDNTRAMITRGEEGIVANLVEVRGEEPVLTDETSFLEPSEMVKRIGYWNRGALR